MLVAYPHHSAEPISESCNHSNTSTLYFSAVLNLNSNCAITDRSVMKTTKMLQYDWSMWSRDQHRHTQQQVRERHQ